MAFTSDKISPSTQRKMARVLELLTSLKTKVITSEPLSQTERRLYWAAGSTLESLAGCIEQLKHDLAAADQWKTVIKRRKPNKTDYLENIRLNSENLTKPNMFMSKIRQLKAPFDVSW